jgi:microcystin-dependent protein
MSDDTAPVGALMAFGGPIAQNRSALLEAGWLPCNGTAYGTAEYAALFQAIGTAFGGGNGYFNVPDLRGRFTRGVSHGVTPARDPGAAARTASNQGGAAGDAVGSLQGSATGLPVKPFVSDAQGNHVHQVAHAPIDTNDTAAALPSGHDICAGNDDYATSDSQGAHTHTLSKGGDAETRPANLYLEWCIKFRNTAS